MSLLAIVVPLALGAAVSPTIIAAQLVSLTAPARPLARAWALAAGCVLVLLVVCGLALVLAAGSGGSGSPSRAGGIVKLVAAALLVALGVHTLRRRGTQKPSAPKHHDQHVRLSRSFALGCGLMATNFSSILLVFPAMHEIGTNDASDSARIVAFLLLVTIALVPAYAPPLVVTLMGERARRPLDALSRFFSAHRQAIGATLCYAFAVLLAAAGLRAVT